MDDGDVNLADLKKDTYPDEVPDSLIPGTQGVELLEDEEDSWWCSSKTRSRLMIEKWIIMLLKCLVIIRLQRTNRLQFIWQM